MGHAAFSFAFGYYPLKNFLVDGSSASSLSVRLSTLTGNELRSLIERLANDGEAIAARIGYLTRPQSAVESIALRIGGIRSDDRFVDHGASMRWRVSCVESPKILKVMSYREPQNRLYVKGTAVNERIDEGVDGTPVVVVDGRQYSWKEFGQFLTPFNGFNFRLECFDTCDNPDITAEPARPNLVWWLQLPEPERDDEDHRHH